LVPFTPNVGGVFPPPPPIHVPTFFSSPLAFQTVFFPRRLIPSSNVFQQRTRFTPLLPANPHVSPAQSTRGVSYGCRPFLVPKRYLTTGLFLSTSVIFFHNPPRPALADRVLQPPHYCVVRGTQVAVLPPACFCFPYEHSSRCCCTHVLRLVSRVYCLASFSFFPSGPRWSFLRNTLHLPHPTSPWESWRSIFFPPLPVDLDPILFFPLMWIPPGLSFR